MSENYCTLALVDDHPIVIEGLRSLFEQHKPQYHLLCFSNGNDIINYLAQSTVDVVLLDIALPDSCGVDICRIIKTRYPHVFVIGFSNQAEQSTILKMLDHGASGFLLKDAPSIAILKSIQQVLDGDIVLSDEVKKILATAASQQLPSLTKREKQILQLAARGKTTAVIAKELFLSKLTVDTYRKNLLQKFEVNNITELLLLLVAHKMM